ncbi:Eco57I restriction-modification methylase domain-containing protein [Halohasta litorea]|uniref:site-specific DNA-methyltransferase (adenine-specific) n=1 Tax=Halohasta litorea TaxID=869891 RepID=A0ABD6DFU1_9EURY|nr:N-6 DNA methylase [Halohasta litorea]
MSTVESLSEIEHHVHDVVEEYVDELNARLSTHDLESVLHGEKDDLTSRDLGSKPETHVQNNLIHPLLDAMGLSYTEEPYGGGGGGDSTRDIVWPDFELNDITEYTIGENKAPNNIEESHRQVLDYLDRRSIGADYAIATDGFCWRVYRVEQGGDTTEFPIVRRVNLRDLLCEIAQKKSYIAATTLNDVEIAEEIKRFTDLFEHDAFEQFVTQTAPQELRDSRQQDVEEFYQLYIEYLFGESEEYDESTCLMDDIRAPDGATDHEQRRFAVTLMNRLLFIKFLEKKDVVPKGTLIDRVTAYEENGEQFAGNFYETQIKPLFYDLFNRRRGERESKHQTGWFNDIPYLNGGLFRPNVDNEGNYRLEDRTLPDIIREVVEGERLSDPDGALDPAILGSVFEMTINHIGGEFGSQKDIGAYYTPGDVTDHITEKAVDPKVKEVVVGAFAEDYDDSVRQQMESYSLGEILQKVEEGQGWFGDPEATQRAYDNLGELRVVDPACGSGHFLTTAMEEIHRVRRGLLRGLNYGDAPSAEEDYESKKQLALNSIYGVDVDPIGVEIARLRVWLKIIEDEWREEFGRLPNIELNVVAGNSLVGLPVREEGQIQADVWDDNLDELVDLRQQYKNEDEEMEKSEVLDALNDIREDLDEEYLKRLTHTYESKIETAKEWLNVVDSIQGSTLHPTIESIQIRREDGEPLTGSQEERLESIGCRTYKYSARMNIQNRHEDLKEVDGRSTRSHASVRDEIVEELTELFEDGFVFSEVERQPVKYDLDQILGDPFHWIAEFPEVAAESEEGGHDVEFDIVVGNPPYGDIMGDADQLLTDGFKTGGMQDIAAHFVERQIQLLSNTGYFGNITTLKLIYRSNLKKLRDILRSQFRQLDIACFAHRPQQVFPNAIVRVAIMTGQRTDMDGVGTIRTSQFLQFNKENRQEIFNNISFKSVEGYELRDRIGGSADTDYEVIPKIGTDINISFLNSLKSKSDRIIADVEVDEETSNVIYRRRGGGYWLNAVPQNIHGEDATTIDDLYFDDELTQNIVFLIVNSSTFYVYWVIYGFFYVLNTGHITRFPIPEQETLEENANEINQLADELWNGMQEVHSGGSRDQFDMPALKPIINRIDDLFGELYGFDEDVVEYLKDYNSEYGRKGGDSEELSSYIDAEAADN